MAENIENHIKVLIAVVAKADSGKTTTLFNLIERLDKECCEITPSLNSNKHKITNRIAVVDGVKVAISTQGDSPEIIKKNLNFARKNHAEIVVYAQRTGGKVFDVVSEEQKKSNCWLVLKYKNQSQSKNKIQADNEKFTQELYDQLKQSIETLKLLSVFPYQNK